MSHYHALVNPLTKEAMPLVRAAGRSLMSKGLWRTAARGGEKLSQSGSRFAHLGGGIQTGASAMRKASPWMTGYGVAGAVGAPFGYDLPGSSLMLGLGAPGWGLAAAVPGAVRSGRLATGDYNDAIKQDAQRGAQQAGTDWIAATQADGRNAYDPASYQKFLQDNAVITSGADRYLGGDPVRRPNWWHRLGNTFENPTGNVIPEVRQGIHDQMRKGASAMEKEAMAAAAKAAWTLARGAGRGRVGSGLSATGAGWGASAPGKFLKARPSVGKWGGRALTTGLIGLSAVDAYDAVTSEKPYDEQQVMQEGYDGGQAGIRQGLAGMTPFQRRMAQFDPSLAVQRMDGQLPGAIANWEQQNQRAYQPGVLGTLSQVGQSIGGAVSGAWNGRGTPGFYSYDGAGNTNYL